MPITFNLDVYISVRQTSIERRNVYRSHSYLADINFVRVQLNTNLKYFNTIVYINIIMT